MMMCLVDYCDLPIDGMFIHWFGAAVINVLLLASNASHHISHSCNISHYRPRCKWRQHDRPCFFHPEPHTSELQYSMHHYIPIGGLKHLSAPTSFAASTCPALLFPSGVLELSDTACMTLVSNSMSRNHSVHCIGNTKNNGCRTAFVFLSGSNLETLFRSLQTP